MFNTPGASSEDILRVDREQHNDNSTIVCRKLASSLSYISSEDNSIARRDLADMLLEMLSDTMQMDEPPISSPTDHFIPSECPNQIVGTTPEDHDDISDCKPLPKRRRLNRSVSSAISSSESPHNPT